MVVQVPIAGSTRLFLAGACFYVFAVGALGILLGTSSTMGQFGLLAIPVLLVMMLLSGTMTPMESMPVWLQYPMKVISPTPCFVIFAQDVLYRGAEFSIVWPGILVTGAISEVSILVMLCTGSAASFSAAELVALVVMLEGEEFMVAQHIHRVAADDSARKAMPKICGMRGACTEAILLPGCRRVAMRRLLASLR
jgi:hypothetical protein